MIAGILKQPFIVAATLLYLAQVATYFVTGNRAQALILIGYTIANVGLIWSAL